MLSGGGNVTMSQKAPVVADERLEQRPVAGAGTRARTLDEKRWRRTPDDASGAVRVRGRRRRRGARGASRVDRRCGGDEGLDDPGDTKPDHRARRCARRTWARGRPAYLSLRVDEDHRVRRDLRLFRLNVKLDRAVEVFFGRLFHDDRLGQQLRVRVRHLKGREECFRRRRLELEIDTGAWVWRR